MENTAVGFRALRTNNSGALNTAIGYQALQNNTMGFANTANGVQALFSNDNGFSNTATGVGALQKNTSGSQNTANGQNALFGNESGGSNIAVGNNALGANTAGSENTAIGNAALSSNTMSDSNTAVGSHALSSATGSINIALGRNAGGNITMGNRNIDIGNAGVAGDTDTIRIGSIQTRAFIAGIRGKITGNMNAVAVLIDSAGQLGTTSSSRRFKKEIKPMDQASEAILALKPVTFHYKTDTTSTPQFGLIAEEVAEVNSDLVVRDDKGEIYTVRYEAVNAMLLNEFLKEHRTVQAQEASIAQLKQDFQSKLAEQQKQIETLSAGLQKVSAQVEMSRRVPQTVVDNH
jgi:hypothetical protein